MESSYPATISSKPAKMPRSISVSTRMIWYSLAVSMLLIAAFMGGIIYQKNNQPTSLSSFTSTNNNHKKAHLAKKHKKRDLLFYGTITSVSSNQITITNSKTNKTKVYTISPKSIIIQSKKKVLVANLSINQKVRVISLKKSPLTIKRIIIL